MRYGLHETPPIGVTIVGALQWLIVTLANTFVVPLMISQIYGLDTAQSHSFMQQTIFFVGVASLLQVWIGHRYPLMEGPAGLWWGIFIILAQIGTSIGVAPSQIGQSFELGLLLCGAMFLFLGLKGWIGKIQEWFTPAITGTYMTLLSISLCSNFIKGMLGVGYNGSIQVQPGIAILSLVVMGLVIWFLRIRKIASFAVLLGIVIGWFICAVLGWTQPVRASGEIFAWPTFFFWGPPRWDAGIVLTSVLTGFVLLTNLITSLAVVGASVGVKATKEVYNRGGIFTGVSHLIAGSTGVVGMIPISLAAAVIQTTKLASRLPFNVAMVLMMIIGVFPTISAFLTSIPTPVAYAAMFVSYTQLLGFGLKDFARARLDERGIIVIGSALLVGVGVMFVPTDAWKSLHPLLSFLLGNGLLLGVLVALLFEHVIMRDKTKQQADGKE
ncbi:permease [Brevibacillus fluminis]|uniref:Permease n=1 Tax=Brevibacillus fluminis TaxID=511487 RepID=A0A3M8DPJ9_9BACL|nr:purine/pyrimidine permease [Brevibacillus fluminis]RNB89992.1 permease [Brevibacillus fluminis]